MIEHLTNLATHTTYGVPGFIQDAAEFALAQGQELEDEVAAPFRRRRLIALDLLAQQNIVRACALLRRDVSDARHARHRAKR